ncbi:hypothetical protein CYR55_06215 [Chimaeribacter californicus]|uniref:Uncharacterized protein n=1 Tax=Chimaeribacter californicus TaxID=2060067 RepID=A0A2N5EEE0_9GAMM|nr:hypothetical protein CYR55_06215 [Chimaeribacter californicus]
MKKNTIIGLVVLLFYCCFSFMTLAFFFRGCIAILSYLKLGYFNFSLEEVRRIAILSLIAGIFGWLYMVISHVIKLLKMSKNSDLKKPPN